MVAGFTSDLVFCDGDTAAAAATSTSRSLSNLPSGGESDTDPKTTASSNNEKDDPMTTGTSEDFALLITPAFGAIAAGVGGAFGMFA